MSVVSGQRSVFRIFYERFMNDLFLNFCTTRVTQTRYYRLRYHFSLVFLYLETRDRLRAFRIGRRIFSISKNIFSLAYNSQGSYQAGMQDLCQKFANTRFFYKRKLVQAQKIAEQNFAQVGTFVLRASENQDGKTQIMNVLTPRAKKAISF